MASDDFIAVQGLSKALVLLGSPFRAQKELTVVLFADTLSRGRRLPLAIPNTKALKSG